MGETMGKLKLKAAKKTVVKPNGRKLKIVAIILARGGSKRIYKKNIALLGGKPLIQYTIDAAIKSKYINRIIVSTDDADIAGISRECGAEVPFLRPVDISQDDSSELAALKHAIGWLGDHGYVPDIIVKLFPTSPFRKAESIDRAVEQLIRSPNADSVRSVRLCKEHPCKSWFIQFGHLQKVIESNEDLHVRPYHTLPKVYVNNASFDVIRLATIMKKNSVTGKTILPFVMSEEESIDINTPLDLELAKLMMKPGTANYVSCR